MKNLIFLLLPILVFSSCREKEQRASFIPFEQKVITVDTDFVPSVTIDSAILCYTTLTDLRNKGFVLNPINDEKISLIKKYNRQSETFYLSSDKGLFFGTYQNTEIISSIWLTEDFNNDFLGKKVDMQSYTVKEMLADFPDYIWSTTGVSNYWRYSNNDTTVFYIKVDESIPKFPLKEDHYINRKIDGVKTELSCWNIYGPEFGQKDTVFFKPMYAPLDSAHANYYLEHRKPGILTTIKEISTTGKKTIREQKKIGKWLIYNPDHSLKAVEYYNNGELFKKEVYAPDPKQ